MDQYNPSLLLWNQKNSLAYFNQIFSLPHILEALEIQIFNQQSFFYKIIDPTPYKQFIMKFLDILDQRINLIYNHAGQITVHRQASGQLKTILKIIMKIISRAGKQSMNQSLISKPFIKEYLRILMFVQDHEIISLILGIFSKIDLLQDQSQIFDYIYSYIYYKNSLCQQNRIPLTRIYNDPIIPKLYLHIGNTIKQLNINFQELKKLKFDKATEQIFRIGQIQIEKHRKFFRMASNQMRMNFCPLSQKHFLMKSILICYFIKINFNNKNLEGTISAQNYYEIAEELLKLFRMKEVTLENKILILKLINLINEKKQVKADLINNTYILQDIINQIFNVMTNLNNPNKMCIKNETLVNHEILMEILKFLNMKTIPLIKNAQELIVAILYCQQQQLQSQVIIKASELYFEMTKFSVEIDEVISFFVSRIKQNTEVPNLNLDCIKTYLIMLNNCLINKKNRNLSHLAQFLINQKLFYNFTSIISTHKIQKDGIFLQIIKLITNVCSIVPHQIYKVDQSKIITRILFSLNDIKYIPCQLQSNRIILTFLEQICLHQQSIRSNVLQKNIIQNILLVFSKDQFYNQQHTEKQIKKFYKNMIYFAQKIQLIAQNVCNGANLFLNIVIQLIENMQTKYYNRKLIDLNQYNLISRKIHEYLTMHYFILRNLGDDFFYHQEETQKNLKKIYEFKFLNLHNPLQTIKWLQDQNFKNHLYPLQNIKAKKKSICECIKKIQSECMDFLVKNQRISAWIIKLKPYQVIQQSNRNIIIREHFESIVFMNKLNRDIIYMKQCLKPHQMAQCNVKNIYSLITILKQFRLEQELDIIFKELEELKNQNQNQALQGYKNILKKISQRNNNALILQKSIQLLIIYSRNTNIYDNCQIFSKILLNQLQTITNFDNNKYTQKTFIYSHLYKIKLTLENILCLLEYPQNQTNYLNLYIFYFYFYQDCTPIFDCLKSVLASCLKVDTDPNLKQFTEFLKQEIYELVANIIEKLVFLNVQAKFYQEYQLKQSKELQPVNYVLMRLHKSFINLMLNLPMTEKSNQSKRIMLLLFETSIKFQHLQNTYFLEFLSKFQNTKKRLSFKDLKSAILNNFQGLFLESFQKLQVSTIYQIPLFYLHSKKINFFIFDKKLLKNFLSYPWIMQCINKKLQNLKQSLSENYQKLKYASSIIKGFLTLVRNIKLRKDELTNCFQIYNININVVTKLVIIILKNLKRNLNQECEQLINSIIRNTILSFNQLVELNQETKKKKVKKEIKLKIQKKKKKFTDSINQDDIEEIQLDFKSMLNEILLVSKQIPFLQPETIEILIFFIGNNLIKRFEYPTANITFEEGLKYFEAIFQIKQRKNNHSNSIISLITEILLKMVVIYQIEIDIEIAIKRIFYERNSEGLNSKDIWVAMQNFLEHNSKELKKELFDSVLKRICKCKNKSNYISIFTTQKHNDGYYELRGKIDQITVSSYQNKCFKAITYKPIRFLKEFVILIIKRVIFSFFEQLQIYQKKSNTQSIINYNMYMNILHILIRKSPSLLPFITLFECKQFILQGLKKLKSQKLAMEIIKFLQFEHTLDVLFIDVLVRLFTAFPFSNCNAFIFECCLQNILLYKNKNKEIKPFCQYIRFKIIEEFKSFKDILMEPRGVLYLNLIIELLNIKQFCLQSIKLKMIHYLQYQFTTLIDRENSRNMKKINLLLNPLTILHGFYTTSIFQSSRKQTIFQIRGILTQKTIKQQLIQNFKLKQSKFLKSWPYTVSSGHSCQRNGINFDQSQILESQIEDESVRQLPPKNELINSMNRLKQEQNTTYQFIKLQQNLSDSKIAFGNETIMPDYTTQQKYQKYNYNITKFNKIIKSNNIYFNDEFNQMKTQTTKYIESHQYLLQNQMYLMQKLKIQQEIFYIQRKTMDFCEFSLSKFIDSEKSYQFNTRITENSEQQCSAIINPYDITSIGDASEDFIYYNLNRELLDSSQSHDQYGSEQQYSDTYSQEQNSENLHNLDRQNLEALLIENNYNVAQFISYPQYLRNEILDNILENNLERMIKSEKLEQEMENIGINRFNNKLLEKAKQYQEKISKDKFQALAENLQEIKILHHHDFTDSILKLLYLHEKQYGMFPFYLLKIRSNSIHSGIIAKQLLDHIYQIYSEKNKQIEVDAFNQIIGLKILHLFANLTESNASILVELKFKGVSFYIKLIELIEISSLSKKHIEFLVITISHITVDYTMKFISKPKQVFDMLLPDKQIETLCSILLMNNIKDEIIEKISQMIVLLSVSYSNMRGFIIQLYKIINLISTELLEEFKQQNYSNHQSLNKLYNSLKIVQQIFQNEYGQKCEKKNNEFSKLKSEILKDFQLIIECQSLESVCIAIFEYLNQNQSKISKFMIQKASNVIYSIFFLFKIIQLEQINIECKRNISSLQEINNFNEIQVQNFRPSKFIELYEYICRKGNKIINQLLKSKFEYYTQKKNKNKISILTDPFIGTLLKNPQVINFQNKRKIFRLQTAYLKKRKRHSTLKLIVNREFILESSIQQILNKSKQKMLGTLQVQFEDQEAIDLGGVTKQWFTILSKEIFNPNYALFKPSSTGTTYQPSPLSSFNSQQHLKYFKFIGRVVGKALFQNICFEAYFTPAFYKHILGMPINYHDIQEDDYDLHKNMKWIVQNNITGVLDLTFSYQVDNFGEVTTKQLMPGGIQIAVTEQNKLDYIQKLCYSKMALSIEKQIQSFLEGFHELIPPKLVSIFDSKELQLMISGLPKIDISDLRQNTEFVNYSRNDNVIIWLFQILENFDLTLRASFLQFVTGTSKVPSEGFRGLRGLSGPQKFNIHKDFDVAKLPRAHTCFNQLDLPNYPTHSILKEKLTLAITQCKQGFEMV